MPDSSRRRTFIIIILLLLALLLLLLVRCKRPETPREVTPVATKQGIPSAPTSTTPATTAEEPAEVLTDAAIQAPLSVNAGAVFSASWTGPNNRRDYLTIVAKDAPENTYRNYRDTKEGSTLELTAAMEPGEYEVRYVAGLSKKVLGRSSITVVPIGATLNAPDKAVLGTLVPVTWTGPNNREDYITLVSKDTPDGKYGNYTNTSNGSPLSVAAPPTVGEAELRYMTGQGNKVLARHDIQIVMPEVSLSAPTDCIAGSAITITWTGPNNNGDYITIVSKDTPDGRYGNYTNASNGSPLKILVPISAGQSELRYMTGQGAKVLARTPITVVAAKITLSAPAQAVAGTKLAIEWTGPNHPGDYLTIVPQSTDDGQYAGYENTSAGPTVSIAVPMQTGTAEIRYMSGQGSKVLARRPVLVVPAL